MASGNHVVSFLIRAVDGATKTILRITSSVTKLSGWIFRNGMNFQA